MYIIPKDKLVSIIENSKDDKVVVSAVMAIKACAFSDSVWLPKEKEEEKKDVP